MERTQKDSQPRNISSRLETLRPRWTEHRYNDSKLNLSNNICYDSVLLDQVDNLLKTVPIDLRQYTDEAESYHKLAEWYGIDAENIVVGHGIGELVTRILKLPMIKQISIISPTWPMVEIYCEIYGIDYVKNLNSTANALYLANPNGMTGDCISREQILELLPKYDFVIVDEAYGDFADENQSMIDYVKERHNLIVLKTFSKSLSLAGLRFGYAFSNRDIIEKLQLERPSCALNSMANTLTKELLSLMPSHISRMKETKKFLETNYPCRPSQGNFVIFQSLPKDFEKKIMIKEIANLGIRMALLDMKTLKGLI